jgi:hypothetical protein
MHRKSSCLAAALTLVALLGPALAQPPQGRPAQPGRVDHPNLRAALHELREARQELRASQETWPPGHKERALQALQDGMDSLKTILAVRDVDSFRGYDRNPDYYKRFADHPRLRSALQDLRQARDELRGATSDFRGMKERALDDIEVAIGEIVTLMRFNHRPGQPR